MSTVSTNPEKAAGSWDYDKFGGYWNAQKGRVVWDSAEEKKSPLFSPPVQYSGIENTSNWNSKGAQGQQELSWLRDFPKIVNTTTHQGLPFPVPSTELGFSTVKNWINNWAYLGEKLCQGVSMCVC